MHASDAQMKIRLPAELRDGIVVAAEANKRSLNAEIVARLERSFDHAAQSDYDQRMMLVEIVSEQVAKVEKEMMLRMEKAIQGLSEPEQREHSKK
ncbi:Arc family DNA-binding protein [Sphingobium sp. ba1]|jgi:hypothetical protein|uniref:Arc family DNA-binding protein n=1 Tax=Sphingobium sp. ba1 TaxID=1522072 RepID=UPI00068DA41D|nr:Arc family DNA-binding protein [Sphingobium sp. ba1]